MRALLLVPVLVALALWAAPARAADLTKIDRQLAKEPTYQNQPKYCLLVFGPEAKTRVWLVLDGKTLYVDKNGNSDLTEEGERIVGKEESFEIGAIPAGEGTPKYKVVQCRHNPGGNGRESYLYLQVDVEGKFQQYTFARLADRPAEARFHYFDGPLTVSLSRPERQRLTRGEKSEELYVWIGTTDLDKAKGSTAVIDNGAGFPKDIHPVAEIEFPNKSPGGKPIKLTVTFKGRC